MDFLKLEGVSKAFEKPDRTFNFVLNDINFAVKEGESFYIIGPNGSGKTTLLRMIASLTKPTKGKILFKNQDIAELSKNENVKYRRELSFVRQKPVVLNTSVFNNISYGLRIRDIEWKEVLKRTTNILKKVGLIGFENENARSLSGGEMQRVAIAMNFILSPQIYILDEVSANLDPKNILLLEEFIREIRNNKKKTIIASTHDKFEAIKFADRIAVLTDGKISQIGTPDEIFRSPKDEFTARFVGFENILIGNSKIDKESGLSRIKINHLIITATTHIRGEVKVCIRPESIFLSKQVPEASDVSYRNTFKGNVMEIRDLGNICHILVRCGSVIFLAEITQLSKEKLKLKLNSEIFCSFKATDVKCL